MREEQIDGSGVGCRQHPAPCAKLARREPEDLADRVARLPDAREARRERDLGDGQVGADQQHPRVVRTVRAGKRQGAGAELGGEQPVQMPGGVAEAGRETGDALALHHAVGDETHGASGGIPAEVPSRGAGCRLGQAPLARSVACLVRGGAGGVERDVLRLRSAGRARRTAVDARGANRRDELPVESDVARVDGAIPLIE